MISPVSIFTAFGIQWACECVAKDDDVRQKNNKTLLLLVRPLMTIQEMFLEIIFYSLEFNRSIIVSR